jgi:hypothetical protein
MNSNRGIYRSHSHTLQFVGHDQEDITNSPKGCTLTNMTIIPGTILHADPKQLYIKHLWGLTYSQSHPESHH